MARRERPDELRLEAWRSLLMAAVSVRERLEEEMAEERGLPLTWYEVMLRLEHAPGRRLRMQELARGAVLGKSALTQIADRMVEAGLVRRETCASDRRGVYLVLTAAGRRAFVRAAPVHLSGIQRHFGAHLDDREAGQLSALLQRLQLAQEERAAVQ